MLNFHHFGRGRSGRVVAALSILAGGTFLAWVPAGPAAAAVGGSISGTVTVPSGYVVTNALVYLVNPATNTTIGTGLHPPIGGIHPAVSGAYSFTGVAPGTYTVFAEYEGTSEGVAHISPVTWQWWDHQADSGGAATIVVTNGSTAPGINFDLVVGATITGTVTTAGSVGYLSGVGVFIDPPSGSEPFAPAGSHSEIADPASVQDDGTYMAIGLQDLTWEARFNTWGTGLAPQNWDHVFYGSGTPTGIDVVLGATTAGIDAYLPWEKYILLTATLNNPSDSFCYEISPAPSNPYDAYFDRCGPAGATHFTARVPAGDYMIRAWEMTPGGDYTDYLWWNGSGKNRLYQSNAEPYSANGTSGDAESVTNPTGFDFSGMPMLGAGTATVELWLSVSPLYVGVTTNLTAVVTGGSGTPTGIVEFYDDQGFLGDAPLVGGSATFLYTVDHVSEYLFALYYRGDVIYNAVWAEYITPFVATVDSVTPGYGPTAGGTSVTITGTAFTDATSVTFGGVAGTSLTVLSDSTLTVTTPPGTNPAAAVVVTSPVGSSAPFRSFAFIDSAVVTMTPTRIADISGVTAGVVRCVPVVGMAGVPVGATGVILNVTTAGPAGGGNVVIYPDYAGNSASAPPASSTVNFETGRDVANSAFVALPTDGKVCSYTQGASLSRLILDVTGYIVPGSGITLQSAQRLMDTRGGTFPVMEAGPVSLDEVRTIQVTGNAGVPAGATAVLVNVTVTGVAGPGHLRMWAAGTALPNTSVVNYAQGQDKANGQIVALSSDGKLSFGSFSNGPVEVIIDVVGYVSGATQYVATAPTRIVETRAAYGIIGPIPGPLTPVTVSPVTIGTGLVPNGATAVVLNVTAVQPSGWGHIRVYPDTNGLGTTPPPDTSTLNYIPGRDIPNLVVVQLPADRIIDFYNVQGSSDRTDLVVDVVGYIVNAT